MKAILALEDGTIFAGHSCTGQGEARGEVLFSTDMSGYQHILHDPAYYGKMVCLTYPLIGNCGVTLEDIHASRLHCPALIMKECCAKPSNWQARESLPAYLARHGVMGLEGIDTRALTRYLRMHGTMRGIISTAALAPEELVAQAKALPAADASTLMSAVSPASPYLWTANGPVPAKMDNDLPQWPDAPGKARVLVYDYGTTWDSMQQLENQGLAILAVPPLFPVEKVQALAPSGILLSSGPGDPAMLTDAVTIIRELCATYPVAGLGLGHQLLALALGGRTYKLKFGHHGANHPVRNERTGKIAFYAQHHDFCADIAGVGALETTHVNLNDMTLEGLQHTSKPIFSIQYQPEACPEPDAQQYFYTRFSSMLKTGHIH
ncbi:MAG: glutamine-hydrolyzing carbamoyl-phosphate synthase small subunit [Desulfovibrionales bacterium]|nr:glutamine-hydrolyzing carbamoyl-phosphate synthase small subunit [Desulfovibrionales bacterium]